jgi:hypothetical protein
MTPTPAGRRYIRWHETFWPVVIAMALTLVAVALAACAPASDPDPRCAWPGFRCAVGGPPQTALVPPVPVDNPFRCPRRASP